MTAKYVQVGPHRYKVSGAITEAFRYQLDATGWADAAAAEDDDKTAKWVIERRDEFLEAMPPRARWLLIQTCLELASNAAAVQESKK